MVLAISLSYASNQLWFELNKSIVFHLISKNLEKNCIFYRVISILSII